MRTEIASGLRLAMNARSQCQVDDPCLQFESLAGFSAPLDGCNAVFQGSGETDLSYKSQDEAWQYTCDSTDSREVLDAYGMFKPVGQSQAQGFYKTAAAGQPEIFVGLPESPHSVPSTCSQQEIYPKSEVLGSTPTSHRTSTPLLPYNATKGSYSLPLAPRLYPLPAVKLDQGEASPFSRSSDCKLGRQEMWGLMPDSHCLDSIPLGKLDATGSSTLNFFPGVEHLSLKPTVETNSSCQGTTAVPSSNLVRDASLQIDSPLSHSLSESIFDEFSMPDFDHPDHQASLTPAPASPSPEQDYKIALGFSEHQLLPAQLPSKAPDCLPTQGASPPVAEARTGRPRRRVSLAKRMYETDTDLDDLDDYEPQRTRGARPGTKLRRVSKPTSRLEDYLDYQPNERKKAAVTARGRRVNRLQLSEEDNCEECTETGNRRSKHHNPWTVEETEALVHGVESCGGGKWADIKKLGLRAIEKRSAVDLKDKWRNLQAALHRTKSDKKREIPASLLQRVKVLVPLTATKARGEARQGTARKLLRPKTKRGK